MPDYIFVDHRGHTLDEAAYSGEVLARAHAERLAMEHRTQVTLAEVVAYRIAPTCMFCTQPATIRAADWDLCDDHYNAISSPDPLCAECGQPLSAEDVETGETICAGCAPAASTLSVAFLVSERIVEI